LAKFHGKNDLEYQFLLSISVKNPYETKPKPVNQVSDVRAILPCPHENGSPWLSFGNFFGIGDRNLWASHGRAVPLE